MKNKFISFGILLISFLLFTASTTSFVSDLQNLFNNQTKEQISNSLYTRTGHSSKDVPYFIYFKPSKNVDLNALKPKIDNTDIFKLCKAFISK